MAKTATIFSVRTSDAQGFAWKWRSADAKHESPTPFAYFYQCVENAEEAGYSVELGVRSRASFFGTKGQGLV